MTSVDDGPQNQSPGFVRAQACEPGRACHGRHVRDRRRDLKQPLILAADAPPYIAGQVWGVNGGTDM